MEQNIIDITRSLRLNLHQIAERSGEENKTKACLMEFLRKNTSLRLEDMGQWFCAFHEEADASETIAFRADMDALPFGDGASHLCGHDGHSAILAGLGLFLNNRKFGRNIILIFQHAEETGAGGITCSLALKKLSVSRIYAFHNIPGWKENTVLLRRGTFACASRGMTVSFLGAASHAAHPEKGRNPGYAAARFISGLNELANGLTCRGMVMATLIGSEIGRKSFGSAAGNAEIWLTLRSWYDEDLTRLITAIKKAAYAEAEPDKVEVSFSFCDVFPATINDNESVNQIERICRKEKLDFIEVPEPFRWSEDFGNYSRSSKIVLFGIGTGFDWPQLHTENYTFNDNIIPTALKLFSALAEDD